MSAETPVSLSAPCEINNSTVIYHISPECRSTRECEFQPPELGFDRFLEDFNLNFNLKLAVYLQLSHQGQGRCFKYDGFTFCEMRLCQNSAELSAPLKPPDVLVCLGAFISQGMGCLLSK